MNKRERKAARREFHRLMLACAEFYDCHYETMTDDHDLARMMFGNKWVYCRPADGMRRSSTGTYTSGKCEYDIDLFAKMTDNEKARDVGWAVSGFVWRVVKKRPRAGRHRIQRTCSRICALHMTGFGFVSPMDRKTCGVVADQLYEAGNPLSEMIRY